jgi:uncharacterized OB-fold protein
MTAAVPAIDGWFTTGDEPTLLGNRCDTCGTVFFPKTSLFCRNPRCDGTEFTETALSRRGRVWSYTDAQYQPPPPYVVRGDVFTPFGIVAVELEAEQLVVLGQLADGSGIDAIEVGSEVELVVEELFRDDEATRLVWKWKPVSA